ncbi:hypothetical protein TTRE_0000540001 [Trichuris trichiura]|uniref:E3 ubiquitin-protein ligase UBR4 N-terminal domain-containing protein n=1 Tax=Trichuris trichiura TaxID=36087 RepID=A0A077ZC63_TRITR|nr:hypothetical protein TTRE_0000540001 [Trichuris trichiura]
MDWSADVKPLLSSAFFATRNPAYLKRLAQTICACREEIFTHAPEFETFYVTFLALGTHYITAHLATSNSLEESDREAILAAMRLVVRFAVDRLSRTERPRLIHLNYFIAVLNGMCSGNESLPRAAIITLSAHLKTTLLPPHVKATVRREIPSADVAPLSVKEDSEKCDSEHSEGYLVEKVISSFSNYVSFDVVPSRFAKNSAEGDSVETVDFRLRFMQESQRLLKEQRVGELLLKVWLKSRLIAPFKELYKAHVVNSAPNFIVPVEEYERVQRHCGKIQERTTNACSILGLPLWNDARGSVVSSLLDMTGTCLMAAGCAMIAIYSPFNRRPDESCICFSSCSAPSVVNIIGKAVSSPARMGNSNVDSIALF